MPSVNASAPALSVSPKHRALPRAVKHRDLGWTILALFALLFAALVAYWNWQRVSKTNADAIQMRRSFGMLQQILLSLEDAETGQRGYLLTGSQEYLKPYLRSTANLDSLLEEFSALWPRAYDRDKLAQLALLAHQKMAELKATIDARNSHDPDAALAIIRTDRGKLYMDQARVLVATLERDMRSGMEVKSAAVTERARDAGLISVAVSLTLFLLLTLANARLRKQREMANAANRAKSEFLASMSHELRTPLNAIIGYSEMLAEEAEDSVQAPFVADLKKIQAAGRHLLMLINSVLDLSKIEAGRMDLYLETTSVETLVNDVMLVAQPLAAKNHNSLEADVPPDVGSVHTDQTKVRQTLSNLLSNACKFTENGKITLQVRRQTVNDADSVLFTVTDTGVGMNAEEIDRVFDPFTQADASTSRRFGGTGLGLTLSRRFAQMMGGEITVESWPNAGSAFTLRLPANVADKLAVPGRTSTAVPARPGREVVLVIDDEPAVHDLLKRTLTKHGFHVESAYSGEEGLRLARKLRPVAITLDVMMPGMDGWTVLSALKSDAQVCDIPVLMLTIIDTENVGYALGATDYLTKPVDRERLLSVLARYRGTASSPSALLVEDDEYSRLMMRQALEAEGWKVEDAENGRLALDSIDKNKPGIILLDLMMPQMDGFEFLEQLRGCPDNKNIPVIIVTARELTTEDRVRLNGHVSRVLVKGAFQVQDLLTEVSQLVLTRVRAHAPRRPSSRTGS